MPLLSKYAKFFAELEHGAISKDRGGAIFDLWSLILNLMECRASKVQTDSAILTAAKKKSIGGSAPPTVSPQPLPIPYTQAILNQAQVGY